MAEATEAAARIKFDFLAESRGKRIIIETFAPQSQFQPEQYVGILEEIYDDSLLVRPDNGRLVLIYKHAAVSVSQA
jgi:hypothetical protein